MVRPQRKRRTMLWTGIALAAFWWVAEALLETFVFQHRDVLANLLLPDRHEIWMRSVVALFLIAFGIFADRGLRAVERATAERAALQKQLEVSLTKVLGGFLPICGYCKKIREKGGRPEDPRAWQVIETYISARTDAQFSHSVCPDCMNEHFPDVGRKI